MSRFRISQKATTELRLLSLLRSGGLTGWRRNYPLPGKPDFVFPAERLVLFVDGCFWHGHQCGRNLTPKRNAPYWLEKILRNRRRDLTITGALRREGWTVLRIWECRLNRQPTACLTRVALALARRRNCAGRRLLP